MLRNCLTLTLVVYVCLSGSVMAEETATEPPSGIEERLGEYVPMDLQLVNEAGDSVRLGDLIDRPTIVSLVYYTCPSVCRPLLDEVSITLEKLWKIDLEPGKDYRVLTISFDDTDSPAGSARLKDEYYATLPGGFPEEAWTFLTGDAVAIARFTESVGFRFKRDGKDFAHPTSLIVVSPKGKITRYLFGAEYLPVDVKLALIEASEGRVGPTIARMLKFCFSYDPKGRKYVLNVTRVVGLSTIIGLVGFLFFLTAGKRRSKGTA